jgi:hypothetical protein
MPKAMSIQRRRELRCSVRSVKASSAMMPPSPLLSARMMKAMYLRETTRVSDQKISDRMPMTLALLIAMPCEAWKHSLSA